MLNSQRHFDFPGFARLPDLTVWLHCVATSINRKRGFSPGQPHRQALPVMRPFAYSKLQAATNGLRSGDYDTSCCSDVAHHRQFTCKLS
ncbi:hypothetical protein BJS_01364 [Bradyrhizobium japonicum SEMIA 5079]|nr:hypothetical protein BJS_01364 [Bradyrhizobium japonicum SEMIA 5079]